MMIVTLQAEKESERVKKEVEFQQKSTQQNNNKNWTHYKEIIIMLYFTS